MLAETAAKALAVVKNNLQYEVSLATAQQRPKVLTIQVGILSRYLLYFSGRYTYIPSYQLTYPIYISPNPQIPQPNKNLGERGGYSA